MTKEKISPMNGFFSRAQEGKDLFFHYFKNVDSIMSKDVKYLTRRHKVSEGLAFIKEHQVHHIPIVEKECEAPVLIGIVSQRDLALAEPKNPEKSLVEKTVISQPLTAVMESHMVTASPEDSIFKPIKLMIEHKIDCIPVVMKKNSQSFLKGILTTTDILKLFNRIETLRAQHDKSKGNQAPITRGPMVDALMGYQVSDVPYKLLSVQENSSIREAANIMQEHRVRHVLVVDKKGKLCGLVSDRDVIREIPSQFTERYHKDDPHHQRFREGLFIIYSDDLSTDERVRVPVKKIMTKNVVTTDPSALLTKVVELLCAHRIGCLPVMDRKTGKIKGIVTRTDILQAILDIGT